MVLLNPRNLTKPHPDARSREVMEKIFSVLVRDFSRQAVELHGRRASTPCQMELALRMVRKPIDTAGREDRDAYEMRP
jgi:acyl-CoA dehydrogenase